MHYKASLILKITVCPKGLGGLHKDIVEYKCKEPYAGCKIDGVGGVMVQLFKGEMDCGSERGADFPLEQAHNSASICTPLSLPPIHHSLTAPSSRFYLTSCYPYTFLLHLCGWDSAVS